jgi:hypothetical protein
MQSNRLASFSFFSFLALASLPAIVAACGSALTATSDPVCAALDACCTSIGGATGSTCQQLESSAKSSSSGSSCQAVLQTYQAQGYCGGLDGGSSLPPNAFDGGGTATGSCVTTGTCGDASIGPGSPVTTDCEQIGSCADGQTYATCVTTGGGQECTANVVFSGGVKIACTSCTDCAGASASAAAQCGTPVTGEDAGGTVDSGPDCGTPPVLHPETAPGAYCPFTATGAVHCAAGQECCEPPPGADSTCQAGGSTCPITGSLTWQCTDPLDCQGSDAGVGAVCCATGATTYDTACTYYRGTGFTGSHCALSCQTAEVQLCSAANDPCVSPTQCTPFKVEGLVLGTCL